MLSKARGRVSPALVISVIALCGAIGGGAAVALPGAKSVDKNDLKKKIVKSKHVVDDSLTGKDVKESTLNIPQQALPADDVFGAAADNAGNLTASTLSGTTVQKTSNVYRYTFPRSVQGCVPVAGRIFASEVTSNLAGTANPNSIDVTAQGADLAHTLIVTCP